jgi:hypothetical protein
LRGCERQCLGAQAGSEGVAKGDLPFRIGQRCFEGGEERRQFRLEAGATGARRRAVAAVAQAVAIARLAAAFATRHSNRAKFFTPSLPRGRLNRECAMRFIHLGRIAWADGVLISAAANLRPSHGRCWRK